MAISWDLMVPKHKVFISFYHADDQPYKDTLVETFGNIMINKSVADGEYDSEDSDGYIKRLIREDKISDSSVVLVLVGPNTKYRKHVDWEIYAGLRASINGRAGLAGILLPEIVSSDNEYDPEDLPGRLRDNVDSGYAKIYLWDDAIMSKQNFEEIINTAFNNRIVLADKAVNSRIQMKINGHR